MSLIETAISAVNPAAGIGLRLMGALKSGATYLFAHPMAAVALLAGVFGAVEHHEANKWARVAEQRGDALSTVKTANAAAIKSATAAKELIDAKNVKIAVASDQAAAALDSRYHAAVMRLADAQSAARRADLPGQPAAAQGAAGTGIGPVLPANTATITISTADGLTCADNTARLQAAHDWAVALGR